MPKVESPVRDMAPCWGCPDREPGCHDRCDAFKAWRKNVDKVNEARRAYSDKPIPKNEKRYKYDQRF